LVAPTSPIVFLTNLATIENNDKKTKWGNYKELGIVYSSNI